MPESLLPLERVIARVGFKRSKLYALIESGEFPEPIKIGKASRWPESRIERWIADRIAASESDPTEA